MGGGGEGGKLQRDPPVNTKESRRSREWILVYDTAASYAYEEVNIGPCKDEQNRYISTCEPTLTHLWKFGMYHKEMYKNSCCVPIVPLLLFVASFRFGSQTQSLECLPGLVVI